MEQEKVNAVEGITKLISAALDNLKWEWSTTGRFTRFRIPVSNENGTLDDTISISIMYHENKEKRFKVFKSPVRNFWYLFDNEKNKIVKEYSSLVIANAACEQYNRYHENQGWDQFKNRTI